MRPWSRPAWLCLTLSGCLGPNPHLDPDDDTSSTNEGDGDVTGTETGTGTGTDTGGSCEDRMLNGSETAIDCGGDCDPCPDGSACLAPEDCASGVCDETCQVPNCEDAVHNGDELELDCGGPDCGFCELSDLTVVDDSDGSADFPSVAVTPDEIAIGFVTAAEAKLRWFDPELTATGPSSVIGMGITPVGGQPVPLVVRDGVAETRILGLVSGDKGALDHTWMVEHDLAGGLPLEFQVNDNASNQVTRGAIGSVGMFAPLAWVETEQLLFRRYGFDAAEWADVDFLPAETDVSFTGSSPDLAVGPDGSVVVVWSRCDSMDGTPCSIALRRFAGGDWDTAVIEVAAMPDVSYVDPHVAIDSAGRVAISWTEPGLDQSWAFARMFDSRLVPGGDAWILDSDLDVTETDVVALDDGTFAFAWTDKAEGRLHLSRFVTNGVPKLPDGDEAPWASTVDPSGPALANVEGRLVVVWSGGPMGDKEIHAQVLGY